MPKLRWLIVCALASFIVAVTAATFFKEVGRIERLSGALEVRMEELVELTRKNQELAEKISNLATDEGIAHEATVHFNLVKSGEKIYRIRYVSEDALRK